MKTYIHSYYFSAFLPITAESANLQEQVVLNVRAIQNTGLADIS
jgi:hypothetical protein